MSKSVGNVVCPLAAMERWGVDVVRWYMCRVGGRMRDDVGACFVLVF
jgi:methionyl-tRNA synthetase